MNTIQQLLLFAKQQITASSDSPQLDAELLLAHVLHVSRTYLHTWPTQLVTPSQQTAFIKLLERRKQGEPIAYIVRHREFWSLDLIVTKDTLIPRPETELLVEIALKMFPRQTKLRVADIGTGSGAIAIALAVERPQWQIIATDISVDALAVARFNAQRLHISNVSFFHSDYFSALLDHSFDLIVSNPPYLAEDDPHLTQGDVRFEPRQALVADDHSLSAICLIATQARDYLIDQGWLMLEHGFDHAQNVREILHKLQYQHVQTYRDLQNYERVTIAKMIL